MAGEFAGLNQAGLNQPRRLMKEAKQPEDVDVKVETLETVSPSGITRKMFRMESDNGRRAVGKNGTSFFYIEKDGNKTNIEMNYRIVGVDKSVIDKLSALSDGMHKIPLDDIKKIYVDLINKDISK